MASVATPGPFSTKPLDQLRETAEGTALNRTVGALDLTALGIGGVIGTGIFVIVGEAIGESGPALVISFLLADPRVRRVGRRRGGGLGRLPHRAARFALRHHHLRIDRAAAG
jgi:hypothetical protein